VLLALASDSQARRGERMALAAEKLRRLAANRALNWDAMKEEEHEAFVDDLIHEARANRSGILIGLEVARMSTVTLKEAQARLGELILRLNPGEELLIAENGQPMAKLVRSERTSWPCRAGSAADQILWIAPDFDEPLDDFEEYME